MPRAAKNPLTAQQERFAQLVASGKTQADAYREAYPKSQKWKDKALYTRASALMANEEVVRRVEELRKPVIEAAQLDRKWVLDRLMAVADRCMQIAPVVDRKGEPVLTETADGGLAAAYEFNSMGANRALELLGKEVGMFVDRSERGEPGAFQAADKDAIRQRIKERTVRLGLAKVVPIKRKEA